MSAFDAIARKKSGELVSLIFTAKSYDSAMKKKIPGKKLVGVKQLIIPENIKRGGDRENGLRRSVTGNR